jgi:hypothetical protein
MEQDNTENIPRKDDKKIEFIFWALFFGSPCLLALVVCIGLYLLANDISVLASYLICLGIAAMGSFIVYGPLRRYLKRPMWRWSVSRCAAHKMNKTHKFCMWLGTSFSHAGVVFIMNREAWRWIFRTRGDRILGSMPFKLSLLGPAMFFIGLCFIQIGRQTHK